MKNVIVFVLLLATVMVFGQAETAEYVGTKKCKICHNKAEEGAQFTKWESGPHAKALETLKSDAAKAIATKMGLKVDAASAPECLVCHVTGWGSASGYKLNVDAADVKAVKLNEDLVGVGCESCHGAGSLYKSKKTMVGIADGSMKPEDFGLTKITAETCTVCHNKKSPTFKGFDYAVRVKEIAHPIPEK